MYYFYQTSDLLLTFIIGNGFLHTVKAICWVNLTPLIFFLHLF